MSQRVSKRAKVECCVGDVTECGESEPDSSRTASNSITALAEQLLDYLATQRKEIGVLTIVTHDYPDADALASSFGLYYLAEQKFDIRARILYGGVIGRTENKAMATILRIPARRCRLGDLLKAKDIAVVDTQPGFGNNPLPLGRRVRIVIDQHLGQETPNADLVLIHPNCGATSVIVAKALLLSGLKIRTRLATALAYGILSDTLDLYRANDREVVEVYLEMLRLSDMRALAKIQNPPRSRSYFVTLDKCIRNAEKCRGLIVSHLGEVKSPELVAQMAEFLLTYEHIVWSFCTGRYKGRLHLSLRTTRTDVQAGEILRDVVGDRRLAGGHQAIAGGSVRVGLNASEAEWRSVEEALQRRLAARLRLPSRLDFWRPFRNGSNGGGGR